MASRLGKADDELFFQRPSANGDDSPTVEPLRIHKPMSPKPPTDSGASGGLAYPPQVNKHTFPLPPGASSSANPLPYPDDDEDTYEYVRPESRTHRAPYPDDRKPTPDRTSSAGSGGQGKQNKPLPGMGNRTASNDISPRLNTSPVEKRGPGLAERRGTAPKPLPESPGPDLPDKEGLFAMPPRRDPAPAAASSTNYPEVYYPPPVPASSASTGKAGNGANLIAPTPNGMNRFASTASTSTTRATRGSPPPPETPIDLPDAGGIEARYAAAGISGTATLSGLQSQSAAAAQRQNQYGAPPPVPQMPQSPGLIPVQNAPRPWTPTESPDNQPHGPPTVYQGPNQVTSSASPPPQGRQGSGSQAALEQDFQRMQMSHSPPPAYSSVTPGGAAAGSSQAYPAEKQRPGATPAAIITSPRPDIAAPLKSPELQHPGHPAFANDPRQEVVSPQQNAQNMQNPQIAHPTPAQQFANSSPFQGAGPSSPPPLPEGWIAHLDQNSGQYYYIHLATQATQWEFPKGPTPLNHDIAPLSPTMSINTYGNPLASPGLSAFGKTPLGSPSFPPHTPGYAESIMSMTSQTPTAAGFSGPPPSAGVDMYKVAPTNGVYFGPYLRYVNMDFERGVWLGTIMLVTDAPQPPTIHIHQSIDLSPNPRQLKPNPIFTHQRYTFYRYDLDLPMGEGSDKWTYAITSHLGCTRYEFLVAGRFETNWRFIAHSGNDFAMNTSANERSKLGGLGFMWKDILQKNVECGGFHVQLGLGDQIYGDRLWKDIPLLKQWLAMSGKDNRKNAAWTARHEEDVSHAYFHYYSSHFDQPYLREAFAQIPHILQIDDHDM